MFWGRKFCVGKMNESMLGDEKVLCSNLSVGKVGIVRICDIKGVN